MRWRRMHPNRGSAPEPNPLFTKRNWQSYVIEHFSTFGLLVIFLILGSVYLLLYSSLFAVTRIEIQGTETISPTTLDQKYVRWQLGQRRWLLLTQNNTITFDSSWLKENINNNYGLESIEVKKKLPHTITVTLIEKKPELIWAIADAQYYIGQNGQLTTLSILTDVPPTLPLLYDESNTPVQPGDTVITSEQVLFLNELFAKIASIQDLEISKYSVPNNLSTQVNARVGERYTIYFDSSKPLDKQIEKLERVLKDEAFLKQPPREYLDVRIGDRVYYK